jgi:hypothetical protein
MQKATRDSKRPLLILACLDDDAYAMADMLFDKHPLMKASSITRELHGCTKEEKMHLLQTYVENDKKAFTVASIATKVHILYI